MQAIVRKNRAQLTGDTVAQSAKSAASQASISAASAASQASLSGASAYGAATSGAGNAWAQTTDTASAKAAEAFDAALGAWSETRLKVNIYFLKTAGFLANMYGRPTSTLVASRCHKSQRRTS